MKAVTPGGPADLVVTGRLVTPGRVREGAAVLSAGRIVAVTGVEDVPAGVPRLDARDGYVLPGLIDSQVRLRAPGREGARDWTSGSRAAVAGGVTTVIAVPDAAGPDAVRAGAALAAGSSLVDYAFHVGADPQRPERLAELDPGLAVGAMVRDARALERVFAVAAARGLLLVLDTAPPGGRHENGHALRGVAAVARAIGLVRRHGVRTHLLHLSSAEEADLVAVAQAAGLPVTFELTGRRLAPAADQDRWWAALCAGEVACLGSGHTPGDGSPSVPGTPAVREMAAAVWTGMRRHRPDEDADTAILRLVDHLAARPAELFGLPGKGRLEPGADADLAIFRPDGPRTSPAGRVLTTIRRGEVVWDGATRTFGSPAGRWLRPAGGPRPRPQGGAPEPARPGPVAPAVQERGVDAVAFRRAMACLAAPITVLTCYDAERRPCGLTVSAVSSLSLRPPLVLVCLDRGGRSHDVVAGAEALCLHVLGPGQEDLVRRFAVRGDRFEGVSLIHGRAPELADVPVRLSCRPQALWAGGDHTVLVALVEEVTIAAGAGGGLVWHQRATARAVPVKGVPTRWEIDAEK